VSYATKNMVFCGSVLCVAWLSLAIAAPRAISHFAQGTEEPVPAFHNEPPQGPLPGTVSPTEFSDVVVQNAYILAARVKRILYQQPCYCHCDRSQGHKSLLDCFASKHGAECGVMHARGDLLVRAIAPWKECRPDPRGNRARGMAASPI